jgi:hypothetical protein
MEPIGQQFDLAGERFWMLVSLLCLSVEEQEKRIGPLLLQGDPRIGLCSKNGLRQLLSVLSEAYSGWYDSFAPEVLKAEELQAFIDTMFRDAEGNIEEHFSRESFYTSSSWARVRTLAVEVLAEVDFPARDVPDRIDFKELEEFPDE